MERELLIEREDTILVTGANGFIGKRVVGELLNRGFRHVRCFVRSSTVPEPNGNIEYFQGNLLSRDDCRKAAKGVAVIFHLAAGIEKSFAGSFLNSVVTTRNLLDAALEGGMLKRFLNVSSFAVYTNMNIKRGGLLDEKCEVDSKLASKFDPYAFAKAKQDELVMEFGEKRGLRYVIVRPGTVYGPGKMVIPGRVGIDTFGFFIHLGGSNRIPLSYVDNCAEAIVLAGLTKGIDGEVFNIVDDDLPESREFLKLYKKNVRPFFSLYIPYLLSYFLCYLWEKYSEWSGGQLPPVFNRSRCSSHWKGNRYSNHKLKGRLGWQPKIPFSEASSRYFEYCKTSGGRDA